MKPHPYGTVNPHKNVAGADLALNEALAVARETGRRACLTFGTALGFYRDGGYVVGDNDIDIAVIAPQDDPDFTAAMQRAGFGVGSAVPALRHRHFWKHSTLVDVFWRSGINFYDEFGEVEYKGKAYPVPKRIEAFLEACYADWRTPSREATRYYD